MNFFSKSFIALTSLTAVLALGATSASAKPFKSKKTVYKGKRGGTMVVKTTKGPRGNKTVVFKKKRPAKHFMHKRGFHRTPVFNPAPLRSKRIKQARFDRAPRVTRFEQRKLTRALNKLTRMQSRFFADGIITQREARKLDKQQRKLNRIMRKAYRS